MCGAAANKAGEELKKVASALEKDRLEFGAIGPKLQLATCCFHLFHFVCDAVVKQRAWCSSEELRSDHGYCLGLAGGQFGRIEELLKGLGAPTMDKHL